VTIVAKRLENTVRVATFALSQSGTGVREYHPLKIFGIPYAIWCIFAAIWWQ